MKNNTFKRGMCLGFVVVMCISQTLGCANQKTVIEPMEPEESVAVSYDIIGGKDVMPFGCQTGPYTPTSSEDGQMAPDFITDEIWNDISDMGLNLIFQPFVLEGSATTATEDEPERWNIFCSEVRKRAQVAKRVAEKYNLMFIPLQEKFDEAAILAENSYWLYDGVHPTAMGHAVIKREWLKAFEVYL